MGELRELKPEELALVLEDARLDATEATPGWRGLVAERMLARGFPLESIEWTFESYAALPSNESRREASRLARAFAAGSGRGLLLGGDAGRGKTGLACAIGRAVLADATQPYDWRPDVLFTTWDGLLREARSRARDGVWREDAVCARYASVELLILDDLGDPLAEGATDWQRRVARAVLLPRYDAALPTVITTNVGAAQLQAQLTEALVSRLHRLCKWVAIEGDDLRRAA